MTEMEIGWSNIQRTAVSYFLNKTVKLLMKYIKLNNIAVEIMNFFRRNWIILTLFFKMAITDIDSWIMFAESGKSSWKFARETNFGKRLVA